MVEITIGNRTLSLEELQEIVVLMENQQTTDRDVSTSLHINGNYAVIDVVIDEDGNVFLK